MSHPINDQIIQDLWDKAEDTVRGQYTEEELDDMMLDDFKDKVQAEYDRLWNLQTKF